MATDPRLLMQQIMQQQAMPGQGGVPADAMVQLDRQGGYGALKPQIMGQPGPSPYGALQLGGVSPMAGGMAQPDFNAILQQQLVNAQAEQAQQGQLGMGGGMNPQGMAGQIQAMMAQRLAERLGARTGGAMQFDPSQGIQGMRQDFRDWRQAGNQPVRPFGGGGGMGAMQPPAMQPPTQPAGVATLPGGGVQSALGADQWKQRGRLGGGGGGNANQFDTNAY